MFIVYEAWDEGGWKAVTEGSIGLSVEGKSGQASIVRLQEKDQDHRILTMPDSFERGFEWYQSILMVLCLVE